MSFETASSFENFPKEKEGNLAPPEVTKFEVIEQLERPIENILEQIQGEIEIGNYDLIIGDDASGRIPTLIVSKVLKEVYRENDKATPKTIFLAGSRSFEEEWEKDKQLAEHLGRRTETQDAEKKVLIVTDTIDSGDSLTPLVKALAKQGKQYDIVTIGIPSYGETPDPRAEERQKYLEKKLGGKIFYGQVGVPEVYAIHSLAGVKKDPEEVFSQLLLEDQSYRLYAKHKKSEVPVGQASREFGMMKEEEKRTVQSTINRARRDVDIVVKRILAHMAKNKKRRPS